MQFINIITVSALFASGLALPTLLERESNLVSRELDLMARESSLHEREVALLRERADACATATTATPATRVFVTPSTSPTTTDPHQQFSGDEIGEVTCNDQTAPSLFDQNIAELKVCNGIGAPITDCKGVGPISSSGVSGGAIWRLQSKSGDLDFFKGNWEGCCNAARATCPGKTFTATCFGANGTPDFIFALGTV